MNIEEYIASGILELYVAGSLSEKENEEVYEMITKHPEVLAEVESIEAAIVTLSGALTSKDTAPLFSPITQALNLQKEAKVIPMTKPSKTFNSYSGWAAAVVVGGILIWTLNQNNALKEQVTAEANEKRRLENRIKETNTNLAEAEKLINVFRDKDVVGVALAGQAIAPDAYAKVYVDKKTNSLYLDVQGLPEPPEGKVYQVWSLTLNPLTPTSMGTLDTFVADTDKIFEFKATAGEQAFGITLEPAGGSASPTLTQLYTLGVIPS